MPGSKKRAHKLTEDEAIAIQCERSGEEGYISGEDFLREMGYDAEAKRLPSESEAEDAEDADDLRVWEERKREPTIRLEEVLARYGRKLP